MSEKSEAKRISADAYVDQERFQYRMWSEKDVMQNHYGHGFDDGAKWSEEELSERINQAIHGLRRMSTSAQKDLIIQILEGKRERW